MKLNKDILHIILIVQVKSNRYIHELKKTYCTWSMMDEKIYFEKCEEWKNSFYEMWEKKQFIFIKMLGMKKFILWNMKDYESNYIKFDLIILP